MEKTLVLKAQVREGVGSKFAARERSESKIPAVVYGHKETPQSICLDRHDFTEAVHHGVRLFEVQIKSKKQTVMIKDLQYDYLGKEIIHVDLMRVSATERVKVEVPIEIKGTAKGAADGGIVEQHLNELEVECVATSIPEKFVVRVNDLGVGDTIHASQIELPEGVKLITDPDTFVAACHTVTETAAAEEVEAEEPAGPEVISEKKAEEEPTEEAS
ncbi:MAG: 50S ribosomal protein L25 [Phycisphaerae bacterium]|jgi:large subunit ribosomal protein L25